MAFGDRIKKFTTELRQRSAFRAGALYAIVAWVVVQAASIAFPAFGLPGWSMRALLVVAFAGFPIIVILAWTFEFTSRGLEVDPRTSTNATHAGRKWWLAPLVAGISISTIAGTAAWLLTAGLGGPQPSPFVDRDDSDAAPVVAVLPLENLTGRGDYDWASEGFASLVRDELARSRRLAVVSTGRTFRMTEAHGKDRLALMSDATSAGITHVVTGEILRTPRGLTVATRLTDLRRNVQLGAEKQQALTFDTLLNASTPVSMMIKQALGVPETEKVDLFVADFATQNLSAYEAFIAGMENFLRFEYQTARIAFESAVTKAPEFAMARYRLAHTLAMLGETDQSLREISLARAEASQLPELDRLYIAAAEAYFKRDLVTAEQRYRWIVTSYPYETEARLLLVYILDDLGSAEALEHARILTRQESDSEVAFGALAYLALKARKFDVSDSATAKYLELAPDNPNAHLMVADSHFLRGQLDEARAKYQENINRFPEFASSFLQLGYLETFSDHWEVALSQFEAIANEDRFSASDRITAVFEWAELLRADGRCAAAAGVLDRFANIIDQEQIRVALSLELRARCELDLGRVRQAEQLARQAVERTSGMSTRYRYVAATAQIADGRLAAAEATIAAIEREQSARPPGDFTSRKAAEHLHAMIRLARGDLSGAEQAARASLLDPGKQYDIYELGLARILAARQDNQAALDILQRIGDSRRPEDPRLDLELSRRRAALLQLSLTSSEKSQSDAAVIDRLQARWAGSDSGFQPREELLSLSRL